MNRKQAAAPSPAPAGQRNSSNFCFVAMAERKTSEGGVFELFLVKIRRRPSRKDFAAASPAADVRAVP